MDEDAEHERGIVNLYSSMITTKLSSPGHFFPGRSRLWTE